ncbi:hypothetical protein Cadr_000020673 [Camelus dromedarius]|uniref:Uncharacterized protein n=1 Tax=Camelus dromedarius TaxID=9838 RepID=A0A5N4CZ53_CAMDR|nr:hypothetical protein Cadr_000020673 [Camelus dromedarius]
MCLTWNVGTGPITGDVVSKHSILHKEKQLTGAHGEFSAEPGP